MPLGYGVTFCGLLFVLSACSSRSDSRSSNISAAQTDSVLNCEPRELYQGDTLTLTMTTPHGGYLALRRPDGGLDFLIYPRPEPGYPTLMPSEEFRNLDSLRLVTDETTSFYAGKEQLPFYESGRYEVLVSDYLETDVPGPVHKCMIFYTDSRRP